MLDWLKRKYRKFMAFYPLDSKIVCEMSEGLGVHNDYHDYHDSTEGEPWHFILLTCKRCGKKFYI